MNRAAPIPLLAWLALLGAGCGGGRLALVEDNDLFSGGTTRDRDYSQGARIEYTRAPALAADWERRLLVALEPLQWTRPDADDPRQRAAAHTWFLRQRIFTPGELESSAYQPDDRPYAGWLELGLARTDLWLDADDTRRRDRLERLSLTVGTTGSASLARETQIGYHNWIDEPRPNGWRNQIPDEPTLGIESLTRTRWLFLDSDPARDGAFEFDSSWEADWRLGNGETSAGAGLLLRLGADLPRAEGLETDGPWQDPDGSGFVFLRLGGRGVLWDVTLDGTLFSGGPSIEREPWLLGAELGIVALWRGFAIGYSFFASTRQFEGQDDIPTYGRITVGFAGLW